MRENVDAQRGYILAEPAMLALGADIGPRRAHELVHEAARRGIVEGLTLNEALLRHAEGLTLDEGAALGASEELVRRVLGD
jgi:adenylosuccinate lyase